MSDRVVSAGGPRELGRDDLVAINFNASGNFDRTEWQRDADLHSFTLTCFDDEIRPVNAPQQPAGT